MWFKRKRRGMVSSFNIAINGNHRKMEKLALIKERYRKLILEPRKEIESEIDRDLKEEENFDDSGCNVFP
jgi:hypothetical protein